MTQRDKVLTMLREAGDRGVHTVDIRRRVYCANPSQRIAELEARGHVISHERGRSPYGDSMGTRYFLLRDAGTSPASPAAAEAEGALFDAPVARVQPLRRRGGVTSSDLGHSESGPVPPMAIGSTIWPGLAKLAEELGELQQVIGKMMAFPNGGEHPDGGPLLVTRLCDELADVDAAIYFVRVYNGLDTTYHVERRRGKFARFAGWHANELAAAEVQNHPLEEDR